MKLFQQKYFFLLIIFFQLSHLALAQSPIESGSPEKFYNAALSAEKKGNDLEASIALRRALILDPTFSIAREHLNHVLKKLNLPIDTRWQARVAAHVSPEVIILMGSFVGWSGALLLVWLFFTRHACTRRRKFFWCVGFLFFFIGHGMALLGVIIDPRFAAEHQVILYSKSEAAWNLPQEEVSPSTTPLRSTPLDNGEIIAQLPAGSLLSLLSSHGAWSYVSTSSDQQGWIPSTVMEKLIPTY